MFTRTLLSRGLVDAMTINIVEDECNIEMFKQTAKWSLPLG